MLSAIIVCYGTPAELAAALASLRSQTRPPDEYVVIDNGAAEGVPVELDGSLEGVRILRPAENVGYGSGCNLGWREAGGDELLFLNADVVLSAEAVDRLRARLEPARRVGAVGPRVLSGNHLQPSARSFPSPWTGLLGRRSLLTRVLTRLRLYPSELRRSYGAGGEVDWVSGACMLVRRDAFEEVGGFDPGYWMYWEDADLCRRLANRDWRIYHEPSSLVHHATGASGVTPRTITAFHQSAQRFAERYIARNATQRRLVRAALRTRCRLALSLHARTSRPS